MCENEKLDESILEPESQIGLVDYLDEFIQALRKQLHSDCLRWGNTWLKRPKEGQELRTKARYTDYFDMFEEAGTPVPWMKIVGGALICWIRENHPELCIDANECEDVGKPSSEEIQHQMTEEVIGVKVSPEGVEPILHDLKPVKEPVERTIKERMSGNCVDSSKYFLDMRGNFDSILDIDEYRRRNPRANGEVYTLSGHLVDEDLQRIEEKAVEDMTTKELVESEPTVQHKSDCAVHNEPAMPAGECDCQDCNPIAHVVGEKIRHHNGILAYSPGDGGGKILLDSVVFRLCQVNCPEKVIGTVDKTGKITPTTSEFGLVGVVTSEGSFAFETLNVNFDKDEITVTYDYEYKLPKD